MIPVIGTLIEAGLKVVETYFPPDMKPEDKAKMQLGLAQVKKDLTNSMNDYSKAVIQEQSSNIRAEANGESWLQRNWRPLTMLSFVFIIVHNFILYPYLSLFMESPVKMDIPQDMWGLLKLGLGGYVVGRSVEKAVKSYSEGKK